MSSLNTNSAHGLLLPTWHAQWKRRVGYVVPSQGLRVMLPNLPMKEISSSKPKESENLLWQQRSRQHRVEQDKRRHLLLKQYAHTHFLPCAVQIPE